MNEKQILRDQISGLIEKGKGLRQTERTFIEIQTRNKDIEAAIHERDIAEGEMDLAKADLAGLKRKKATAVKATFDKITAQMGEVLPDGSAIFEYYDDEDDGKTGLHIGWNVDGRHKPYNGLSGGEKQTFDAALAHVLKSDLIILEAAELDQSRILAALEDLGQIKDKQVLICTCHEPASVPASFTRIALDEVTA
jgi:hypothetical protein